MGRLLVWVLAFWAVRRRNPLPELTPGCTILVIRPGGIGDAVLLLPALNALKSAFRPARIDVVAEARNASVFSLCEAVTGVYRYERPQHLFRVLSRSYNVVVDSEQWHRLSAVLALMTRAPLRVGFATNDRARLFTHAVGYSHGAYEADSFLALVAALTGAPTAFDPEARFITVAPRRERDRDRSGPSIALFPGASVRERKWGAERFAALATRLVEHGCRVTVVGGPGDAGQSRAIRSAGGPHVVDMTGSLTLPEVVEVLAEADLMVAADSGLMHLAAAVGTPVVALFGAGIREKWAPRGERHRVLSAGLPCSPCTKFGYTPPCPIDVECLRRLSVDDVLAQVLDIIASDNGAARMRRECGLSAGHRC